MVRMIFPTNVVRLGLPVVLAGTVATVGLLVVGRSAAHENASSITRTVSDATAQGACPRVVPPGDRAAEKVLEAVRSDIGRLYPGKNYAEYRVTALFALAPGEFVPPEARLYRQIAANASGCGDRVARRSWVVLVLFPRVAKLGTSLSQGVVYAAKTVGGWSLWYRYR